MLKQGKIESRLKCWNLVQKENKFFLNIEKFAGSLNCELIKLLEEKVLLNQDSLKLRFLFEEHKDYLLSEAWSELEGNALVGGRKCRWSF